MTIEKLGYGDAMARLDVILEDIDQSKLSLDVMAERVLEAANLLKRCKGLLTETEAKVKDVLEELDKEFGEDVDPF
jgi:exodeoxyribonuclease VII small subunit